MTSPVQIAKTTIRFVVGLLGLLDARPAILDWANWLLRPNHKAQANYSQGNDRMSWLTRPRGALPIDFDCSAATRWVYWAGGAADVMKLGYNIPEGYTGTELSADQHIAMMVRNAKGVLVENLRPTDLGVYGRGTGLHVAMVFESGPDPLMWSMGRQGDPSLVRHSVLLSIGPVTWLRPGTRTRRVYHPPTDSPTRLQVLKRGLVRIVDAEQAGEAVHNGWPLFIWNGYRFVQDTGAWTPTRAVYANAHYATMRG
jgi:hypothetical protein